MHLYTQKMYICVQHKHIPGHTYGAMLLEREVHFILV